MGHVPFAMSHPKVSVPADSVGPPGSRSMIAQVNRADTRPDEHDASNEPANVRPERDAAATGVADRPSQAAQELQHTPVNQHHPCGQGQGRDEEPEWDEREDTYARIQDQI